MVADPPLGALNPGPLDPARTPATPSAPPEIVFTHPAFVVADKPPLWLSHPVHSPYAVPDILTELRARLNEPGLGPPHRLDRETSGAMLFTRTPEAARRFFTLFKQQLVAKTYLAIVRGVPTWDETELDAPLGFLGTGGGNTVRVRQGVVPEGRPAVTRFSVLERRAGHALIEARPRTGRMHQIRAHLWHLSLPLVGDKVYGGHPGCYLEFIQQGVTPGMLDKLGLGRQALHAARLAFPYGGEQFRIEVPLPADLQAYWDALPTGP